MALLSFAHDFEVFNADGKTIYYNITSSSAPYTVAVTYQGTSYSQYSNEYTGHVSIPATVIYSGKTYSVTSISDAAFSGCSLTSVYIPNSVTSIGDAAFSGCSLISVTIGNSVTSIGGSAFSGCWGLKSVTIPNSVTSICDYAFYGCSGLKSVTIPYGVTSICDYAFYGCGLTSITIPNSVTSIGDHAFSGCWGLKSVTIPNSVTSISNYAFLSCSGLTSIVVEKGNTKYDSRNNCNAIIETASNTLIRGCKTTVIPNSVTAIGSNAFRGCSSLTSVTIPNSVTSIGSVAFEGCSGLTSVTIGNSVTSIGNSAFGGCSGLTKVIVPDIAAWCNISFGSSYGNPLYYAKHIFSDENTEITDLVIPNSVTTIGDYAFIGCNALTSVTIPNSVTSIGWGAFAYCSGLTSVTIPNSVTSIGQGAFLYCSGLTSITIPNSVTSIGNYAFTNCTGLTELVSLASIPPICNAGVFENVDKSLCTLKVPMGSKDAYRQADGWKEFVNIEEVDVTGIEAVAAEGVSNAEITYIYDLNGRRRTTIQPGVNIVKMSDGTTRKVIKR